MTINYNDLVGGWLQDKEDRRSLERTSSTPVYASAGDIPERVDPRKHLKWDEGLLRIENQGSIGSCFPAGVLVTMANGDQKPIEDVQFGDEVLSHARQVRRVIDTMNRSYTGEMIEVFVKGWGRLKMTADHVVPVTRDGVFEWVQASDIRDTDLMLISAGVNDSPVSMIDIADYLSVGKVFEDCGKIRGSGCKNEIDREILLDELACWCIGLYVAEGSTDYSAAGVPIRAAWTLHEKETGYVEKLTQWADRLGVTCEVASRKGSKAVNIRMQCGVLASFLSNTCGRFCNHKQVPHFVLSGTESQKRAFILGYYDGDGSDTKMGREVERDGGVRVCNQIHSATASRKLAIQVSQMLVSLGMKPGRTVTLARSHQNHDSHQIFLYSKDAEAFYGKAYSQSRATRRHLANCKEGQWRKIREVVRTKVESLPVYDFTVEVDHSFIADGVAVHNCQGASLSECGEFCYCLATGRVMQFSKMFAYIESQKANNIRTDSGSTLDGGTKASKGSGFCPEEIAPYPSRYPGWSWVTDAMKREAAKYKLQSHTTIKQEEQVREYIGSGLGIVQIGISWNRSMTPDSRGVIKSFSAGGGGGHAVVFCGYVPDSDINQRSSKGYWYILKNSWGKQWGDDGFAYVDPSAVAQMLSHQWTVFIGRSDMDGDDLNPRPVLVDFTKKNRFG